MTAKAMSDDGLKAYAFDLAPEPALILDAQGAIIAINEAAEILFGQGLSHVSRGKFLSALSPGCLLGEVIARCRGELASVRQRGLEVTVLGQHSFIADVVATPMPEAAVMVTLTPRGSGPAADLGVESAGLMSVVGLGQMLAHEIKNPLAGIRGAAQLLRGAASPEDIPLAQLIVDETDRIRRLVDRMEAFAVETVPNCVPVNLHEALDRVMALIGNGIAEDLMLHAHYDPSLPPAWADQDQLIQVFLNLAKNAAESAHMRGDGRGEITLSTAYRHGVRVRGGDGRPGASAPLEVRIMDNGPGVPRRLRDHLFEPFVTTKAQGAGLGLPLVAKIIAAHGGLIDFESEPGRTVFRVLLPVAPAR